MNYVILVAIVIQSLISRRSRVAGAIVGYLITTGILLWGLSLYGEGRGIAFFGIPLSQPVFLIACLVWYVLDTSSLIQARKAQAVPPAPTPPAPPTPPSGGSAA